MLLHSETLTRIKAAVALIPPGVKTFCLRGTTEFSYCAMEVKSHLALAT